MPIKTDSSISDAELKSNHLILIGRPEANALTARVARALPVVFGPASFAVRNHTYANVASAVLAAGVNPVARNFSVVVIAGNSAAATVAHAGELGRGGRHEVKVFEPSGKAKTFVVPAPELVHTFDSAKLTARGF